MAKKTIYKITVTKWNEHNSHVKKSHKKTMISNNFCTDSKLGVLPVTVRWMFLGILLTCGNEARDCVEMSESRLRELLESSKSVSRALSELQSLRVLTFEVSETSLILNEMKVKEEKRKEEKRNSVKARRSKPEKQIQESFATEVVEANASPPASIGQELVRFFCAAWKARYKSNPPMRPQDAKALKQIGETNGIERTKILLEAYLRMNEQWYLKKRHDLATFSNNLTAVAQFVETGRIITNQDLKNIDRGISNANTLKALENGDI